MNFAINNVPDYASEIDKPANKDPSVVKGYDAEWVS